MEENRISLAKRYDIPIAYLDYDYIRTCTKAREMEKIVMILRSGEEGYFPDLTKFAEDKLRELKPTSKLFRKEEKIFTKDSLTKKEWSEVTEPVIEWTNEIKAKDKFLTTISESSEDKPGVPPVRYETKKIVLNEDNKTVGKANTTSKTSIEKKEENFSNQSTTTRIKSTDYRQWDKYDVDTELLKMDLEEEKIKEDVERMNRINIRKTEQMKSSKPLITELDNEKEIFKKLTKIEKETLAMRYKENGNNFFRAKEFEKAVEEYTKCISVLPSAAGYNNRAIAYLKLMKFQKCEEDCNKCLEFEPNNIKALLRKGQALLGQEKRREAYEVYSKVISIDSSNSVALQYVNSIRTDLPTLPPPPNVKRIQIEEIESDQKIEKNEKAIQEESDLNKESKKTDLNESDHQQQIKKPIDDVKPKIKESSNTTTTHKKDLKFEKKADAPVEHKEDLSQLIIPNKIVKSKLANAVSSFEKLQKEAKLKAADKSNSKKQEQKQKNSNLKATPEIVIPTSRMSNGQGEKGIKLIQEM